MDGGGKSVAKTRSASKGSPHLLFRDLGGSLRERLEAYGASRGLTLSDSARELIGKGLEAAAADRVQLHELIPHLHGLLDDLHKRTPASANYYRVMLITLLESVMLQRQIAAAMQKPEVLQKAKKNAMEAYEQLIKEGTV